MTRRRASILFGRTRIAFEVVRSQRRRTIAIAVSGAQKVVVTAPTGVRMAAIERAVLAKASWILEIHRESQRRLIARPRRFVSGESLPYLGRQHQLKVRRRSEAGPRAELRWRLSRFDVVVPSRWSPSRSHREIREALAAWLRARCEVNGRQICEHFARRMGVAPPEVRVRQMHRRWGSCTPAGVVLLDWRLVMAPRRLMEYVCAHEVCHLLRNDHSAEFWKLLRAAVADFQRRRDDLDRLGPTLTL